MKNSRITKLTKLLFAIVLLAFTLTACSEDDDNKYTHHISHLTRDYATDGKYVFEQGQVSTVSFFVEFDSDMPEMVAEEGLYIDLKAGDTVISKFGVPHTVADMDAGITIEVPIPTDTLGTTEYSIFLLSKYGVGLGGSSSHETQMDFVVEVVESTVDSSGADTDTGTDSTDTGEATGTGSIDNESDDSGGEGTDSNIHNTYSFAITTQPIAFISTSPVASNILSCAAQSSATASDKLQYQWFTSLANQYEGATALTGKTDSTISLSSKSYSIQYYFCEVTDPATNRVIRSNIVRGTFNISEELYIDLISQTGEEAIIPAGSDAFNLNVMAQSNGTLTYQWYECTYDSSEFIKIDGATSNIFNVLSVDWFYPRHFKCVITSTLNGKTISVTSETIIVTTGSYG